MGIRDFLCPNGITATPVIDKTTQILYLIAADGALRAGFRERRGSLWAGEFCGVVREGVEFEFGGWGDLYDSVSRMRGGAFGILWC